MCFFSATSAEGQTVNNVVNKFKKMGEILWKAYLLSDRIWQLARMEEGGPPFWQMISDQGPLLVANLQERVEDIRNFRRLVSGEEEEEGNINILDMV